MPLTRRQFLSGAALAATAASVAGCADWMAGLDEKPPVTPAGLPPTPGSVTPAATSAAGMPAVLPTPAAMPPPSAAALLLSRMTFGPRPGDVEQVAGLGLDKYIEQQLNPDAIDDGKMVKLLATFPTLSMGLHDLIDTYPQPKPQAKPDPKATPAPAATPVPGATPGRPARPPRPPGPGAVMQELQEATLVRAIYSERQLYEVMVDFWTNHINIYMDSGVIRWAKTVDDREVIRKHALGNFKAMLTASAKSPAMLEYLNNRESVKGKPNENYAREIMELHTLGVDGGYTYTDIQNVARAFTGWTIAPPRAALLFGDGYVFNPRTHDDDEKTVLGVKLPKGGGESDGLKVIDLLCDHPSTAKYLATKLVRRFVSDTPPPALVDKVAAAYTQTKGDIKPMLRVILQSGELRASFGRKVRRPLEYVAGVMRALDVQIDPADADILRAVMTNLGQPLFLWHTPDGYPDEAAAWINTNGMLARWNIALNLAIAGARGIKADVRAPTTASGAKTAEQVVDFWLDRLLHRGMAAGDRQRLVSYLTDGAANFALNELVLRVKVPGLVALILSSPDYQYR
ncbi:MAG: DUF1800 domain-containing protein [Chloroflexi bacterium]|nr:DUF1800 domain-containing protein [Chloroflexota bacterium]